MHWKSCWIRHSINPAIYIFPSTITTIFHTVIPPVTLLFHFLPNIIYPFYHIISLNKVMSKISSFKKSNSIKFYHTLIAPDAPLLKDNNMFIYVLFIILPSLFNVPFYIPLSLYKPTNQTKSSSEFVTVLIYIQIPSSQTLSYILCILTKQDSSLYILYLVSIFRVK